MIDFSKFNSLIQVSSYFRTESTCRKVIEESRWGEDVVCPYCGHHHCYKGYKGRYVCPGCKNKFSCLVGTIFENTKVSLRKWFMAMYLITSHKKGISSNQLAKDIEVTQKTAWYMLHKIRVLLYQEETPMGGKIELDEVYIGGREYFKHKSKQVRGTQGRSTKTKTPIFGIAERRVGGNKVMAMVVERTDRSTLLPIVAHICKPGSHLYTDELSSYAPLSSMGYDHSIVIHGSRQYVDGETYTNNIEGFWAHLKRMITGTYHTISPYHLQRYLNESVFRWNTRKQTPGQRFKVMMDRSLTTVLYASIKA